MIIIDDFRHGGSSAITLRNGIRVAMEHHHQHLRTMREILESFWAQSSNSNSAKLEFEAVGYSVIVDRNSNEQIAYGKIKMIEKQSGRIAKRQEFEIGPQANIDELRRELRDYFHLNGREWNSPEKYYGELDVNMKFENRPDLDVEVVEKIYKPTLSDVTRELRSLRTHYREVYAEHKKEFSDSNSVGKYSMHFKHRTESISHSDQHSDQVPSVIPVTAEPVTVEATTKPQHSQNQHLYRLCEGRKRRNCRFKLFILKNI